MAMVDQAVRLLRSAAGILTPGGMENPLHLRQ